ncbi:glycosyltransferase family 4 protein [Pseudomonadales bacterium]|nr:glycosyltransferase family 4 protein [Pseudomonadales bacterium]
MLKKIRVGLVVPDSQNWLGGKNYILNLARTLCSQHGTSIELVIFCSPEDEIEVRDSLNLQHIVILSDKIFTAVYFRLRLLETILFGRQAAFTKLLQKNNVDTYFESIYFAGWRPGVRVISWIPDFQHKKFPGFFSRTSWVLRELQIRLKLICRDSFIFSSKDALNDFEKYYGKQAQKKSLYVAPFAIDKESEAKVAGKESLSDYDLPNEYFIVCNQMWRHKNHLLVVQAVDILKRRGYEASVLFTGSLRSGSDLKVYYEIKNKIKSLQLTGDIRILGTIPYCDVLGLISQSIALINPSKFEGWNTSVEEALLLQRPIIASNLTVHLEQLSDSALYFSPDNAEQLANQMALFLDRKYSYEHRGMLAYSERRNRFLKNLLIALEVD